uniref:Uncharacterized protein n=1 Tax=Rhizophora mucronata TaxID=61149 RepID=A0A2P2QYR4_RHIMU
MLLKARKNVLMCWWFKVINWHKFKISLPMTWFFYFSLEMGNILSRMCFTCFKAAFIRLEMNWDK